MNKNDLITFIEKKYSIRQLAIHFGVHSSTIRHWLKKYNLKTNYKNKTNENITEKRCPKCDTVKPLSDFYKYKNPEYNGSKSYFSYCKSCTVRYDNDRWIQRRIEMINYKGGVCSRCGITLQASHYCIFDFHHRDSLEKEFEASKLKYKSWNIIKSELEKCDLVCSNCHRLIHAKQIE